MSSDRIEKQVILRASRERVWRAISDAAEFGSWFGVRLDGPFVEGRSLTGRIAPTSVDADVAKLQEPHAGKPFAFTIERMEPLRRLSFRWHPFAIEPEADYSREPMTLVTFELEDAPGGTLLRISESGFDGIPPARRTQAFTANEGGWEHQSRLIAKYLVLHPDAPQ